MRPYYESVCAKCKFFADNFRNSAEENYCYRYPPQVVDEGKQANSTNAVFPVIELPNTTSCGEFVSTDSVGQ